MRDIKNLNIWKQEPDSRGIKEEFMNLDITELNLSVRSYNCLKRAGCNTIRDIFYCMGEDGQGLRKIRNLGTRSENEIIEKIKEMEEIYAKTHSAGSESEKRTIIKPAKKSGIWELISFIYQTILCKDYQLVELNKFVICMLQIQRRNQGGMQLERCLKKKPAPDRRVGDEWRKKYVEMSHMQKSI